MEDLSSWALITVLCLAAAGGCFYWWLASIRTAPHRAKKPRNQSTALRRRDHDGLSQNSEEWMAPEIWNNQTIQQDLQHYGGQPDVLTHYVRSLMQRHIIDQDAKTIARRTAFLEQQIKRLQVGKEYVALIRELQRQNVVEDTKDVRARTELEAALYEQQAQARRRELEAKKVDAEILHLDMLERKKIEAEIARLEAQIAKDKARAVKAQRKQEPKPPPKTPKSSYEQGMDDAWEEEVVKIGWEIRQGPGRSIATLRALNLWRNDELAKVHGNTRLTAEQQTELVQAVYAEYEKAKERIGEAPRADEPREPDPEDEVYH